MNRYVEPILIRSGMYRLTVLELRVTKVEILAGPYWVLLGSLRLLDALQILAHRVDGAVHVQQLPVQIFFSALLRFTTADASRIAFSNVSTL